MIVAPETRDITSAAAKLALWLQGRMPEADGLRVENLAYPQGAGRSHETILFDVFWSEAGAACSRGCVVRIKPMRHTVFPDDLFEQQYLIMQVMQAQGHVRVARTLWFEPDPTLLGAPFFIMERVRGRVAVSFPPYAETGWVSEATPAQRTCLWENGVRQLAAVQQTQLDAVGFLRGRGGALEGLAQEWDKYVRFVDWITQERPWPVFRRALDRLRANWPTNQPPGVVWGDARLGNIMFDDDFQVAAVMDWEQPSLGGALHDLAWWVTVAEMMHGARGDRPHLAGMGTRDDTVALWRQLTNISTDDIGWYEDFTHLKLSCTAVRLGALKAMPMPDEDALARRLKVWRT